MSASLVYPSCFAGASLPILIVLWSAVPNCNAPDAAEDLPARIGQVADMVSTSIEKERRVGPDRRKARDAALARELVEAIATGAFEILFQPQFDPSGERLVGAEALARWRHPRRGYIGGDALFTMAERAGEACALAHHVARVALAEAARWPQAPGRELRLSLNVTAAGLAQADFTNETAGKLAASGFPPELLTLEITEQCLVADLELSAQRLRPLADLGVRVALDDFGAGFCNFHYLKRLPLHYLKLDRSMVEGIEESASDLAVLRGILAMARALGLEVTAEGIERPAQRETIAREGCTSWQGFLGARPMSAAEFMELARS
jgi:EAL domain-containing protein (putative c-di-GMP-specific phosphodiesterase class I)